MALRKWAFDTARSHDYPVLVLDGGDFVPSTTDSLFEPLSTFMIEGMVPMGYDAVGLGEMELAMGMDYLRELGRRLPVVCSNLSFSTDPPPFPGWVTRELDGLRVLITGYVDPLIFYDADRPIDTVDFLVLDPVESLQSILQDQRELHDYVVVLAHGPREQIEDLVSRVPGVDVVIQGHDPGGAREVGRLGESYFINPAKRSREVSFLTLVTDPGGEVARTRFKTWILRQLNHGDPELERMVDGFRQEHGLD